MYDPVSTTFLSVDPLGFDSGDPNGHRYVRNSPPNAVDPTGERVADKKKDNSGVIENRPPVFDRQNGLLV